MSDNKSITEIIEEISLLPWPQLRKKAATEFGMTIRSEHSKEYILAEIRKKLADEKYVPAAEGGRPKPGYSRIIVAKSVGKTRPKIKNVNGYRCAIPRGIPVDVPTKVYRSIMDEFELVREEDLSQPENSAERWIEVRALKEAVTLLDETPGPDPRPVHELVKDRKNAKYRAFVKQFGYWPTDRELNQTILNKLLITTDPTALADAAAFAENA